MNGDPFASGKVGDIVTGIRTRKGLKEMPPLSEYLDSM